MIFATVIGTICHIDFARVLIYCVGVSETIVLPSVNRVYEKNENK